MTMNLVRTHAGRTALADEIERELRRELMARYPVYIASDDELDLDENNNIVLVTATGDTGYLPIGEPLPGQYAGMLATAMYLRDMDGGAT